MAKIELFTLGLQSKKAAVDYKNGRIIDRNAPQGQKSGFSLSIIGHFSVFPACRPLQAVPPKASGTKDGTNIDRKILLKMTNLPFNHTFCEEAFWRKP